MYFSPSGRGLAILSAAVLAVAGCGGGASNSSADPSGAEEVPPEPRGAPLSSMEMQGLASQFPHEPLIGGQHSPRLSRWVNDQVSIFLEFDEHDVAEATELRFIGLSVKGTFCAETQPDADNGSFPHFHAFEAPDYGVGHGPDNLPPGTDGYWQTWLTVGDIETEQWGALEPGVDYLHSPTPAPECGDAIEDPAFEGPDAGALTQEEIAELASVFSDDPLTGEQSAPRHYKWVNEDAAIFVQFDAPDPADATALQYFGISVRGEFCGSSQPSPDFPLFHRTHAAEYAPSQENTAGDRGHWVALLATDTFDVEDRPVLPGIDRGYHPTPAPDC